jgi:hypothetical protein
MLKPIKGNPGMFYEVSSGKVLRIADYREGVKYDTIPIPDGTNVPSEHFFFRDVYQKSPTDCNFTQPTKINPGERMIVDRVGIYSRLFVAYAESQYNMLQIGDNAHLRVEVNRLLFVEGPVWSFPTGYGWTISYEGFSMGSPAQTLAGKMAHTQTLTDKHDVVGILSFGSRRWCADVYNGELTPAELDTLNVVDPCLVMCILHGLIKDALTK